MSLDHARCSELLAPYLRGGLAPADAALVEQHLTDCDDCRTEALALEALQPPGAQGMTDLERRRLHRGLGLAGAASRRGPAAWLGAVAMIALVAVAAAVWLPQQSGDDSGGDSAAEVQSEADTSGAGGGAALESVEDEDARTLDATTESLQMAPPVPVYAADVLDVSTQQLGRLGRTTSPFPEYAAFYTAEDAERLHARYVRLLGRALPADDSQNFDDCVSAVSDALPYPILPAYAARARVDGDDLFVLGFAWTFSPSGPLDRFMLWGWRPGQCDKPPVVYQTGDIRP